MYRLNTHAVLDEIATIDSFVFASRAVRPTEQSSLELRTFVLHGVPYRACRSRGKATEFEPRGKIIGCYCT